MLSAHAVSLLGEQKPNFPTMISLQPHCTFRFRHHRTDQHEQFVYCNFFNLIFYHLESRQR